MTHKSIEWLEARQRGIGGSDAATILGVNPFMSIQELYEDKTTEIKGDRELTGPMKRGIVLEPVAADLYVEETGRKIRRQPMKTHPEHDFMIGNVDRQIIGGASPGILEIKCPGLQVMAKVKAHGLEDYMMVQLQHYLAVYGYGWGSFALFNAERWDLIHFDLDADQDFISTLIEREDEFWNKYVVPRIPPPLGEVEETDIPQVEGAVMVVDSEEWRETASDLQEARSLKNAAMELEKISKGKIQAMMDDMGANTVEIPSLARFYFKSYPGNTAWKPTAEKLAKEANLNIADYIVTGKGSRRFTPYFLRKEVE